MGLKRFWKCFFIINVLSISAVVAQDKLIPKPVPTIKMERTLPKVLNKVSPLMPPEEYVYFSDNYILNEIESDDVHATCKQLFDKANMALGVGLRYAACQQKILNSAGKYIRCDIYLPSARLVPRVKYDQLFMHELAHCNGWVHE